MRRDKLKQAEDEDFEWEYYDEFDPEDFENWDEAELTEEQKQILSRHRAAQENKRKLNELQKMIRKEESKQLF